MGWAIQQYHERKYKFDTNFTILSAQLITLRACQIVIVTSLDIDSLVQRCVK